MNATTDPSRAAVLSVEEWEFPMLTTAKSAHSRRKIGMVVPKLSIWGVPKLTCSTNGKNTVLRKDDSFCVVIIKFFQFLLCSEITYFKLLEYRWPCISIYS
ncbi:hypothetical protein U1Q18_020745 [Sarracenia purpurea var. burkii]